MVGNGGDEQQSSLEDPKFRAELTRYGLMVDAAYNTFGNNHNVNSYESVLSDEIAKINANKACASEEGAVKRRYVVTAHLYATIDALPNWVDALPLPAGGLDKPYWFGFVAVDKLDDGGLWDIIVAWRGSATVADWMMDMRVVNRVPFGSDGAGEVAEGFYKVYTTSYSDVETTQLGKVVSAKEQVTDLVLGGALALMAAHDIAVAANANSDDQNNSAFQVRAVTFGAPRVGDDAFHNALTSRVKVYHVAVHQDIIPKLPMSLEYKDNSHYNIELDNGSGSMFNLMEAHSLNMYLHLMTIRNTAVVPKLSKPNTEASPINQSWVTRLISLYVGWQTGSTLIERPHMENESGYIHLPVPKLNAELDKLMGPRIM
uniref:Fungal lipase-type domain-containing protein n=1 Tax=Leersia perrieri TaxID=77586 RepID=A0A0D9Y1E8_9ORYZ